MISDLLNTNDGYTGVLAVVVAIILIYLIWGNPRGRKYPPGPRGLPLVGYLPFLTRKPYIKFEELRKIYGPVYSLRIGSRYIVVLSDYKTIKEAFVQDAFFGRPPDSTFELSKISIESGAMNGMKWKEQRRVILHMLRDLGFFNNKMEDHIRGEITELLERLEKEKDRPIPVTKFLAPSMSNNVSSLVFGKRRTFEDPKRVMLDRMLRNSGEQIGQTAWQAFFPWLRMIMNFLGIGSQKLVSKSFHEVKTYFREEVEEHEKTIDPNNVRDFIDNYLLEIQKRKNDPETTFLKPVLVDLVGALFGAGSETVRVTLDWLLLVCAGFPEIQKKVQSEIDEVIGRDRFPSKTDTKRMVYTEAVITELLRWRTVVPVNVLRYTLQDSELNSYFIPKHSYVIANLWGVHHDPDLWGNDVEEFKPERFLSSDGKQVQKPEYYIPFSTGKRQCPGEPLALTEVFLYFTALLQKFSISLPKGVKPDFEGNLGLTLQTKPYNLCMKLR